MEKWKKLVNLGLAATVAGTMGGCGGRKITSVEATGLPPTPKATALPTETVGARATMVTKRTLEPTIPVLKQTPNWPSRTVVTETPKAEARLPISWEVISPIKPELRQTVENLYIGWKARYVTQDGAGEGRLRVKDEYADNRTQSEGMAYGMLISVAVNDKKTFDKLWRYVLDYRGESGLMDWEIDEEGKVVGFGSASDADLDMAYALIDADRKWGGYGDEARAWVKNIWEDDIEEGTRVLKPGSNWGGSEIVNPSYFALGYMGVFQKVDPDHDWEAVGRKMVEVLELIALKTDQRVFVPDWSDADGEAVEGMSYNYTYDATRIGWRMAHAALVDPQGAGMEWARNIGEYFKYNPPQTLFDGYDLRGIPIGMYHNNAFVAPVFAAMAVSGNSRTDEYQQETLRLMGDRYYQDSLGMLSLVLVSGETIR